MSWLPTPPVTPNIIRTLTATGRLLAAGASAREAANVMLTLRQPQYLAQKRGMIVTKTKTKMKYKKPGKSKVSLAVRKEIKKISIRNAEIKNSDNGTSASLLHLQQRAMGITQCVTQGTTQITRVGDEINLTAFRFNIIIQAPTTAGAYSYRILVVYSGEEYAATTLSTSSITFGEIFLPNIVAGSDNMGVVNKKAVTVLHDENIEINSNIASTSDVVAIQREINLRNVTFKYQASGSVYGKVKNLYLVMIPSVVGGTASTTACGTALINSSLDFRDP